MTSADLRKVNIGDNCYVKTELIEDEGESRYKIVDIIGKRAFPLCSALYTNP